MSMKKSDLAKNLGLKIDGRMRAAGVPDRFAQASALVDKREQRRRDAAAGLVAFACKLPADLLPPLQRARRGASRRLERADGRADPQGLGVMPTTAATRGSARRSGTAHAAAISEGAPTNHGDCHDG